MNALAARSGDRVLQSKNLLSKAREAAHKHKKAVEKLRTELAVLRQELASAELASAAAAVVVCDKTLHYEARVCLTDTSFVQIEETWSDDFKVGLRGFVLVKQGAPQDMEITLAGEPPLFLQWEDRADVLLHEAFAGYQREARCGFKAVFQRRAQHEMNIILPSSDGLVSQKMSLAATGYAPIPKSEPDGLKLKGFAARVNQECRSVLEIGSRVVSPGSKSKREFFEPHVKYTGFDFYPDANTDVVGDAHALSRYFPEGTKFDAIFSMMVLEHTAMPWMIALEINKLLPVGGLAFHSTPFTCPLHEMPWDFWRFTHEGLRMLFSPALGFEVITSGLSGAGRVHFEGQNLQQSNAPFHPTSLESNILVRKVRDFSPDDFRWNTSLSEVLSPESAYPLR